MTNRYDDGMEVRRAVLGDAHVDRAEAAKTDFDLNHSRHLSPKAPGARSGQMAASRDANAQC